MNTKSRFGGVKFDSLQFAVCKQTLRSLRQRQTSLLSHICHKIEQRLYHLISTTVQIYFSKQNTQPLLQIFKEKKSGVYCI